MNIMEYRALKEQVAQEEQQSNSQGEQSNVQTQQTATTPTTQTNQVEAQASEPTHQKGEQTSAQTEPSPTQKAEPQVPEFLEINGEKIPVDELKNGYLRQSDYTKKTQELSKTKRDLEYAQKLYDAFSKDPELAQQLSQQFNLPYVDPNARLS